MDFSRSLWTRFCNYCRKLPREITSERYERSHKAINQVIFFHTRLLLTDRQTDIETNGHFVEFYNRGSFISSSHQRVQCSFEATKVSQCAVNLIHNGTCIYIQTCVQQTIYLSRNINPEKPLKLSSLMCKILSACIYVLTLWAWNWIFK